MTELKETSAVKWEGVLKAIDTAISYFDTQRVTPTLRTLYYYLVSKNLIPNTKSSYKTLSRKLVEERKNGRYPWDFLEDKTRNVYGHLHDSVFDGDEPTEYQRRIENAIDNISIESIIKQVLPSTPSLYLDKYAKQPQVCEIWIEKEALASTLQAWTHGITIRVNKGFSSWTFIYHNVESLKETLTQDHEKVTILYLGDLDPSGMDIERFLKEALDYFDLSTDEVELKRVALTPEQVTKYNLPPKPEDPDTLAKLKRDPRYGNYAYDMIVELDALVAYVPEDFKRLVLDAIDENYDTQTYEDLEEELVKLRKEIDAQTAPAIEAIKTKILALINNPTGE